MNPAVRKSCISIVPHSPQPLAINRQAIPFDRIHKQKTAPTTNVMGAVVLLQPNCRRYLPAGRRACSTFGNGPVQAFMNSTRSFFSCSVRLSFLILLLRFLLGVPPLL